MSSNDAGFIYLVVVLFLILVTLAVMDHRLKMRLERIEQHIGLTPDTKKPPQ